ncbi:MAG: amino acid carrier protein [Evtepia sp.]
MAAWSQALWSPGLLILFLLVGGYFSFRTGFFQLFGLRVWMRGTIGSLFQKHRSVGGLSQFQVISTALGATVGTGSIAGVATAICLGGPGAVFWMWVSALLGMMTGYAEKVLAIAYRHKRGTDWEGGPAEYITEGLHMPLLAGFFSIACVLASFSGGNVVQANSIASIMQTAFGFNPLLSGVLLALLTGMVILGGIARIGRVCAALVPAMAALFVGGGLFVLAVHHAAIPDAFSAIINGAFTPHAALSGGVGFSMATAMRYGIARGVFTNEAGMGSSAMAHATADVESAEEQGFWGILQVFLATIVIATLSALVILTSGIPQNATLSGVPLAARAFETVLGSWSGIFLAVCLLLFAFSSLLGWNYYGERSISYLTHNPRAKQIYRLVFIALIVLGSLADVGAVWDLADFCNGLMALANLPALLLLSPKVLSIWRAERAKSRNPQK